MSDEILHCTVHPDRETTLRCNKCGRPMCMQCAVPTPVGYRCRECVRGQQDRFFDITQRDYPLAGVVSFFIAAVSAWVLAQIGVLLVSIFAGLIMGNAIPQAVRVVTQKRRGRYLGMVVAGATAAGGIVGALVGIPGLFAALGAGLPLNALFNVLLDPVVFIGITTVIAAGWFYYGK